MKRGLLILLTALLVGVIGFIITRQQCCCDISDGSAVAHDSGSMLPELEWLHHEFKLTDEQFAKVREKHLAYRPTCEALCLKMAASRKKVQALAQAGSIATPEMEAALQEQATVAAECHKAMLKHLHETASVMSPEQARQYLDAMLPQIIGANVEHGSGSH